MVPIPLRTRNISVAIREAEKMVDEKNVSRGITVADAIEKYLRAKIDTLIAGGPDVSIEQAISQSDTIRKYADILLRLEEFCSRTGVCLIPEVVTEHLEGLRKSWRGRYDHKAAAYLPKTQLGKQKYQEILKSFFRWLHQRGIIRQNPAALLDPITNANTKKREPHSAEDIQTILSKVDETFPRSLVWLGRSFWFLCPRG